MRVRTLGLQPYPLIWEKMKDFTLHRDTETMDELWLVEHPPVYTQGQAGKAEHILNPNAISIIQSDRGGQITYHGPGQLVAYVMIDLRRQKLGIRSFVCQLEQILIHLLNEYSIRAETRCGAPGVYVNNKKIASLGLRVKNGCTYHGIALNVDMDLSPFSDINPCGFAQLQMTQMKDFVQDVQFEQVNQVFERFFLANFGG